MSRMRSPFARLQHLDLLFGARRLWNLRFESCRLIELERQILGVEREGDLPGEMIPYVYFDYVRNREAYRVVPILHHNALDILTLACLSAIVPWAFHSPDKARLTHGAEMAGLARWYIRAEEYDHALGLLRRAVGTGLRDELMFRTMWDIASIEKKCGRMDAALDVLTDLASTRNPYRIAAYEELAKYYEHEERNYARALEMTRAALELDDTAALRKREMRLERRTCAASSGRLL
jgi:tetratricopeptide (TPR) repeat protein